MAAYTGKEGVPRYLTNAEFTKQIKGVATAACMHLILKELTLLSCHSLLVWVAVLLRKTSKNEDFVKIRIKWVSKAYPLYL